MFSCLIKNSKIFKEFDPPIPLKRVNPPQIQYQVKLDKKVIKNERKSKIL